MGPTARCENLVNDRIFSAAGMESSSFSPSPEQLARLAVGRDSEGQAAAISDLTWDNPCGGAFSTANDMGRWMSSLFRSTQLPSPSPSAAGQPFNASLNEFFEAASLLPDGISG